MRLPDWQYFSHEVASTVVWLFFLSAVPAACAQGVIEPTEPNGIHVDQGRQEESQETGEGEVEKELHGRLADYLTNTKWTGRFSIDGQEGLIEESYFITFAEKLEEGDWWKIVARIRYEDHDLTVPLPLEVRWAGETPVITVDKMAVPGLGEFDARVLIRNGRYSGTWAHNETGGHLFGKIEKMTDEEVEQAEALARGADDEGDDEEGGE